MLGVSLIATIPLAVDRGHLALLPVVMLYFALGFLGAVPLLRHLRIVARRLRETDCHLCPDCGYDLRDHADANPCPECGRPWNKLEDTKLWRTTYAAHLKYPKK
ncbi:MAG: hypothetical protein WC718_14685 [Phycisphaerales bacterium]